MSAHTASQPVTNAINTARHLVIHTYPAAGPPGPPDDLATTHMPTGWHHFTTGGGSAWVLHLVTAPVYLVHHVETAPVARHRGHATSVMDAVGQWADFHDLAGQLVCERALTALYARAGWEQTGPFGEFVQMARQPAT